MNAKANILVVDDEPSVRYFLSEELSLAGYTVTTAGSGEQALVLLQMQPIDLVLLDLNMKGLDGLQVMVEIQRQTFPPSVLVLTAHASLDSAITVMRRGGQDYLLKPCRTEELLESVRRCVVRRREVLGEQRIKHQTGEYARDLTTDGTSELDTSGAAPRFIEVHGLLVDRERYVVTYRGEPLHLTNSEFRLLECLLVKIDEVVSHSDLARALHGPNQRAKWEARRAINTHLWNLRKKIAAASDGVSFIETVRGRGYRFSAK